MMGHSRIKPGTPAVAGLPAGVTLQAIDGETMLTPTTMSHNYYSRNGFSVAADGSFTAGKGLWYSGMSWDNPSFFPIGLFFGIYEDQMPDMITLKIAVSTSVTGGTNMTNVLNTGIWCNNDGASDGSLTVSNNAAVAAITLDEVDPGPPILNTPLVNQNGRMWYINETPNQIIAGDIAGVPMSTILLHNHYPAPGGTFRSIDQWSVDMYWFCGATDSGSLTNGGNMLAIPMAFSSPTPTTDQMRRGSNYGNMIDVHRSWGNGTNSGGGSGAFGKSGATSRIPFWGYVENYTALIPSGTPITPRQLNWAVWSNIIHGVRGINYFTYTTPDLSRGSGFDNVIRAGQSISIYNQAIATNSLIVQLASIINSPFAIGFLTAVSPHGYQFPIYEQNWLNGGIEACAHWDGSNFYIFATTRNSESVTNTSATFTIVNTGATTVTVINESRTIPITSGGTQFTDTFANAWTVHIYRIG